MKENRSIKAVIFDMDGILFDTERLISYCIIEAGRRYGYRIEWDTVVDCVGATSEETARIIIETMGPDFPYYEKVKPLSVQLLEERVEDKGVPVKSGVYSLMDQLDSEGIPFALATSTRRVRVMKFLESAGIADRFESVICGDEVENGKPDPEIYTRTINVLGMKPEEVLVFEDSSNGITAASAAGARVVWVPDLQEIPDSIKKRCHAEIGSLDAVADRLGELLV